MDAHQGNLMGDDVEKYMFYKSAVLGLRRRHGHDQALRPGLPTARPTSAPTPHARPSSRRWATASLWISENPARTFWEAVQATIMYQLLLYMDAGYPALAFGRFDQYTWPFLKADLEAGRITMDEAQEIVDAFFLKANCFYRAAPPSSTRSSASATPTSTPPSAASTPRPARTPPTRSPTWSSSRWAG